MLKDEYFVFTGTLTTMTRKQAQSIITGLKEHTQSSVTKKITRLVTGYFPIDKRLSFFTEALRSRRSCPSRTTNKNNV